MIPALVDPGRRPRPAVPNSGAAASPPREGAERSGVPAQQKPYAALVRDRSPVGPGRRETARRQPTGSAAPTPLAGPTTATEASSRRLPTANTTADHLAVTSDHREQKEERANPYVPRGPYAPGGRSPSRVSPCGAAACPAVPHARPAVRRYVPASAARPALLPFPLRRGGPRRRRLSPSSLQYAPTSLKMWRYGV